jgi:uncharacterized repeat protein (TIGR01451 family)
MLQHLLPKHLASQYQRLRWCPWDHRSLFLTTLLISSAGLVTLPAIAASPTPGTVIDNQATGSFVDPADASEIPIESNTVQIIVAEVMGIALTTTNLPNNVYPNNVIYFDFTITNVGNDAAQFFIPGNLSAITGAIKFGDIQVIAYDADGAGGTTPTIDLTDNNIKVFTGSGGAFTSTLFSGISNTNDGSIPPQGSITIRVAVKVTAAIGETVTVTMGDTEGRTPSQNQPYQPSTPPVDIYAVDNPDGAIGESDGVPINGNATESSITETVTIVANPNFANVLLAKRITRINGQRSTIGGDDLAIYHDQLSNPYDDNTFDNPVPTPIDSDKWPDPNTFLIGGINGGNVKPGDEMEYTIYFLSTGNANAENVLFCDRVPSNVTFVPTAFNGQATAPGGLGTGDRGILFSQGTTTGSLSNIGDGDIGQYLAPGISIGSVYPNLGNSCGTNDNGAIVVNLGTIPKADIQGSPPNSYGFVKFRGRVK